MSLLCRLGAFFLIIGGAIALIAGVASPPAASSSVGLVGGTATGIAALVLGVLALVLTRYTRGHFLGRIPMAGAIALLVIGLVGLLVLSGAILAIVGALLVLVGGLMFALQALSSSRHAFFRRGVRWT
ncbi:MAG: hypothetical protein KGJ23_11915 [Euryarchaeota archaeon]|nr:hypothetical protein [Euryarchaeota archaeon]MDE1837302.1 hypothetical protein [Euryarchaeota archaeon]MDE1879826.1 hypothetical protein [Euryarchaeota archaeon]MDE2045267.1 hypothetical protein [Thermoplasmata archaeon]